MPFCRTLIGEYFAIYVYQYQSYSTRDTADFESRNVQPGGQHIARAADITLNADMDFGFDDQSYGFDLGPSDGIGSQDFDLDLNLDFGDVPEAAARTPSQMDDDGMSIEYVRDAAPPRAYAESIASQVMGAAGADADLDLLSVRSRAQSENPFAVAEMDIGFGPDEGGMDVDLGISFGDEPLSEHAPTPHLTPSRACEYFALIALRYYLIRHSLTFDGTSPNTTTGY